VNEIPPEFGTYGYELCVADCVMVDMLVAGAVCCAHRRRSELRGSMVRSGLSWQGGEATRLLDLWLKTTRGAPLVSALEYMFVGSK